MTAAETLTEPGSAVGSGAKPGTRSSWRPVFAFGTGVGVEIAGDSLEIAIVRVRPGGPELLRRATIDKFQERAASDWSSEFREAVRGHQPSGVTVLLPRRDVIVRNVQLPGVPKGDLAGALALRLRSLHPFADDDVAWCWKPVPNGALAGLTRLSTLSRYESLFAEAGIPIACLTFSATALYSAMRLYGEPSRPFLGLSETAAGSFEAYGESVAAAIFSGEFAGSAARAASFGVAELRMSGETETAGLAQLLPRSPANTGANPIDRPLLYAAAIAAGCPLLVRPANFLPAERRAGQSRIWLIPTAILTFILVLCVAAALAIGPYRDRHYVQMLHDEIARVQPLAQRAGAIDRATEHARAQIQLLDSFRGRSQGDFEVLNELTRILPPPTWASLVEIYPDYVIISGMSPQAAPLLKVLDSSPLFHNSEFTNSVARSGKDELFRIKTYRRSK